MAVLFKFRSSVKFDSVDIEGRTSISVRDLKAKIIRDKNLDICQDSDLVFSDSIIGQEYTNENIQIPCGSSVIIKRVPAGSVHVDMPHFNSYQNHMLHNKDSGNAKSYAPLNVETVDFDDFGVDLYPGPEATVFGSDLDADKYTCRPGYEPNTGITRCLEPAVGGCEKLEASGLSDAIPGIYLGPSYGGIEQTIPHTKSEPEVQEDLNVEKMGSGDPLDTKHADLPSEIKCSLCNSFFKEAVMIPCCQHSFCEKCIRQVLLEKARCPKCFSIKSRVEDLLPNISLRQAIEHFLESQNVITVPDDAFCQYAPDGESGIQAKDVFCGGTILQRELELPRSPETGMGSNNWLAESACNPRFKKDAPYHFGARNIQTFPPFLHKNNQIDGETHGSIRLVPDGSAAFDDFQGENMPMHEEAKPASKKKRPPWIYTAGGDKSFLETGRHRKGDRTCYMCGSPDHFIRECPVASSPRPMLHAGNAIFRGAMPGYVPPYWDGALLPHAPTFRNLYRNHGMTAFDTMLIPRAPFSVPPFMPSMYGSIPGFGGYMGMGGVAPLPGTGEDCYISRSEFLDLQCQEKRRKLSKENLKRDQSLDDDDDWERHHYNGDARLQEHKSCVNRENNVSYSSYGNKHSIDGHQKSSRLEVGHRDEKMYHRMEKSSSEIDDMPSSSSWHSEEKHKHYHRTSRKQNERREQCGSDYSVEKLKYYHRSSRNQKERRKQCGSDSSQSHHQNISEKDDKRKRIQHAFKKRQKHHSNSGSGLEHSVSSDKKLQKGSSHNSRKLKHNVKSNVDERGHDRWKMVSGSDEDGAEDYRYCKRKRVQ